MHADQLRMALARLTLSLAIIAIAACTSRAADEAKELVKKSDASYESGGKTIKATRFEPPTPGKYPAIVLLHGLDGFEKNEATYSGVARRLADQGYVVLVVSYFDGLAAKEEDFAFFKANVKDQFNGDGGKDRKRIARCFGDCMTVVSDGVKHVRKLPGVDGERIGLVGFSLGGYLAMAVAAQGDLKITAVVELFGGLPPEIREQVKNLPPTLIFDGDKDTVVPVESATQLHELLDKSKIVNEIKVYEGVGHVFEGRDGKFNVLAACDAATRTTAFLERHLKAMEATRASADVIKSKE
jgi:acetyl esterase